VKRIHDCADTEEQIGSESKEEQQLMKIDFDEPFDVPVHRGIVASQTARSAE
jgi:hypothetical protein